MDQGDFASTLGRRAKKQVLLGALRPSLEVSWALVCACLATGSFPRTSASALRILTTWFIADIVCGYVLAQLVALKRASLANAAPSRANKARSFALIIPYALPGSPGQRLADLVSELIDQWWSRIWPQAGLCGLAALVGAGLALVVASYLGRESLAVLSSGLFLAAGLTILAGRDERALLSWLRGVHFALAWALGYLALAPWRGLSMAVAALVGLHAYARVRLEGDCKRPARWLLWATWVGFVLALFMARQPILAVLVAVASLAEGMSYKAARPSRLGWLLSLLVVALAMPYWA